MSLLSGPKLTPAAATAALLVTPGGRYLLQHRDDIPGIFWPGYWGCFGGAVEPGETPLVCFRRELAEELAFDPPDPRPFATMQMDWTFSGHGLLPRHFFEVTISEGDIARMRLGEGQDMDLWAPDDIMAAGDVIPYDKTVIWMHAARGRF